MRASSRPSAANRRVSAALAPAAPALSPRTVADLAAVESEGGSFLPGRREEFIARAEARRADPLFRRLEEIAAVECGFPRLVTIGSDRLDFQEVGPALLLRALRAAYEAGQESVRAEQSGRLRAAQREAWRAAGEG